MEKTIELEKRKVAYTFRVSRRARGVRLSVACGGVFTVTAPSWVRTSRIEAFILKKSAWVLDKIQYFSKFPVSSPTFDFRKSKVGDCSATNIAHANRRHLSRKKHFAEHKEKARTLVLARLKYFSQFYPHTKQPFGVEVYGFKWNRVAIRNQRSRWGSCSRARNLNFNYKLALLPPHLADYIIVHELCHLGEPNHSPKFWSLVAGVMPEYQSLRKELRGMSIALN